MRIIAKQQIGRWSKQYRDAAAGLTAWFLVAERAEWRNLMEVRRDFPTADGVEVYSGRTATVFNIGGNKYRLITAIHYNTKIVHTMRFLTHKEYDTEAWKREL